MTEGKLGIVVVYGSTGEDMAVAATTASPSRSSLGADVPDLAVGRGQVMGCTRRDAL